MYIDTHTHLFGEAFDEDRDEVVQRALNADVGMCLLPNIDVGTINALHQLADKYPEKCLPMMGLHPGSVGEDWEEQLEEIHKNLLARNYIAVGEIGMDLYWDTKFLVEQRAAFRQQVEWAKELELPIVIHAREAFQEIFAELDQLNDGGLTGVFHCFTGTAEDAERILDYGGFKLGLGGVVTYKNSGLVTSLKDVPISAIVLETDSPYLSPVPFRGKRNESAYLVHIAEKVADIYGLSMREIERITTINALELFKLSTSINR
ncbi:MAG: hydrolase TatD [Bacteroidetes bacterium RIFCSPHIGHO2_02_FULL_44_7]|nr:MAG: hydrolase TatD [Bacteroidetes bacterium RIFCSPHIGHO2_02_FULL_44_7]